MFCSVAEEVLIGKVTFPQKLVMMQENRKIEKSVPGRGSILNKTLRWESALVIVEEQREQMEEIMAGEEVGEVAVARLFHPK